jgi:predicted alpha/beta superfamily hydrolase
VTVGDIRYHHAVASKALPDKRNVLVYLPPGYETSRRRYPVLYLHDGQNVFDGETAFVRGQEWQVDETAERLIGEGRIEPLIIVGIENAGINRIDEYTPTFDPRMARGGKANSYGVFLTRELKRMIDRTYRTQPGRESTALGGSSLGGLVTLFLGLRYPRVFGRLAVMSPSIWWDQQSVLEELERYRDAWRPKIWLDSGTREGETTLKNTRRLRDLLLEKGWETGRSLHYFEAEGADHSERAWAARVPQMLQTLFPAPRQGPSAKTSGEIEL